MRTRTIYTDEFKSEAINMAVSSDLTICDVANNLGLKYKTLYNWVKQSMPDTPSTSAGKNKIKDLESEVRRLKKELKQTKEEQNILKKAAALNKLISKIFFEHAGRYGCVRISRELQIVYGFVSEAREGFCLHESLRVSG